eukprot:3655980-Pleurochrysis_carterae.AAC.1
MRGGIHCTIHTDKLLSNFMLRHDRAAYCMLCKQHTSWPIVGYSCVLEARSDTGLQHCIQNIQSNTYEIDQSKARGNHERVSISTYSRFGMRTRARPAAGAYGTPIKTAGQVSAKAQASTQDPFFVNSWYSPTRTEMRLDVRFLSVNRARKMASTVRQASGGGAVLSSRIASSAASGEMWPSASALDCGRNEPSATVAEGRGA